ncbi:MAG: hypothetical protein LUC93_16855 [Planctomycetaceae bacterium]|nr:hypothetical protein [Planctomycetaceae bacterium]
MDEITGRFLAAARSGEPVYITDVRRGFAALDKTKSFTLDLALQRLDGGLRVFPLRLPFFAEAGEDKRRFVIDYFMAEAYNMLSSLGGRTLTLHCSAEFAEGAILFDSFMQGFGVDLPTSRRTGYGKCLNVIDRMLPALFPNASAKDRRFRVEMSSEPVPDSPLPLSTGGDVVEVFTRAARDTCGKTLLGIDIGGTDIKLVLARDGRIVCCKEYDWYPAGMSTVEEFVTPVITLVKLLAWTGKADCAGDAALANHFHTALGKDATVDAMQAAVDAAEAMYGSCNFLFDGIGMSFPDVVVANKIVGGETLKTRGMRDAWGEKYDKEFEKLTHLDDVLRPFVKKDGVVGIINDGPMAAFTAGVEAAVSSPDDVQSGVFAHTLGTELGTGWVTETGAFPDIPLEVYNFIIDLGSYPERKFEPDDVRSLNNFNTRLPGTLQKYTSQTGVFRLALKYLPHSRPDILASLREKGFIVERGGGLYVPTAPRDMRKPFLEYMMELTEQENDPDLDQIFEQIGVALAVTGLEVDYLLTPAARRRTLFGRLVKRAACFERMRRGALSYDQDADLAVADETIAETPLMRELGASTEYTVAQFAQAVGAVYFANSLLD